MPTSFLVGYAVQDKGLEHCPMFTCTRKHVLEILKTEMGSVKEASFDLTETLILGSITSSELSKPRRHPGQES